MPGLRFLFARLRAFWSRFFVEDSTPKGTLTATRTPRLPLVASARPRAEAPPLNKPDRTGTEPKRLYSPVTSSNIIVEPQRRDRVARVPRDPTTYWQDKGWTKSGDIYTGFFGSNGQRWPGVIKWHKRGLRDCHITSPPSGLWEHPHAPCFSHIGKGKYSVHFNRQPQTVDAVIITVERILNEATGRRT